MTSPATPGNPSPGKPLRGRPFGGEASRVRKQQRRDELINSSVRAALHPSKPAGAIVWALAWLGAMWVLVLVNAGVDHRLSRHWSVEPRKAHGLIGVVVAPLLHASAAQLAANSIAFVALCWLMLWSGLRAFGIVTAAVWLASGLVDWLIAPSNARLVGISAVTFGWMGYILARAFFGRSIKWIAIAGAMALVFAGSFAGLFPHFDGEVYWAGHVAAAVVGVLVAAAMHRKPRKAKPAR